MFTCIEQWHIREKFHLVLCDNSIVTSQLAFVMLAFQHLVVLLIASNEGVLAQRGVQTLLSVSRQVVCHFKHSIVSLQALKSIEQLLDIPQHLPIQDQATRWNSSYYILEWLMEQQQAILAVTNKHCKSEIVKITNLLVSTVGRNSRLFSHVCCYGYTCIYNNPIIVFAISLSVLLDAQRSRINILIKSLYVSLCI